MLSNSNMALHVTFWVFQHFLYKKSINDQAETFKAHSDFGLQCGTFKCNNYATSENYAAWL